MRQTSERHAPELASSSPEGRLIDVRHRFAYEAATRFATPGARILDVGSGEGYGSTILASAGGSCRGVDLSKDAVAHANSRYGGALVTFELLPPSGQLPYDAGSFDLVVSFQVIEHVLDVNFYLAEIRRVAAPQATVLVTTPNRILRLAPGERPWNRFHLREYDGADLRELFSGVFSEVELYGVRGSTEFETRERERVARARRWARLDVFGLRHRLPERLDGAVRSILRPVGASKQAVTADVSDLRLDPDDPRRVDRLVRASPSLAR